MILVKKKKKKNLGPALVGCCAHLGYLSCSWPLGWPWGSVFRKGFWGYGRPSLSDRLSNVSSNALPALF